MNRSHFKPYLIVLLIIMALFLGGVGVYLFDRTLFHQQTTVKTQSVIQRLQELQRLEVLQANLVAYKTYEERSYFGLNTNAFVILASGTAVYGVDLSQAAIAIRDNSITLEIPPVQVLNVILNPDSVDFVGLQKGWLTSQDGFEQLKKEALGNLQSHLGVQARDGQLVKKAQENAVRVLQSMLNTLGFEHVNIRFHRAIS